MMVRYRLRRPDDAELRVRLRALAHVRRRFGYRRLLIFLRREGFMVNHKAATSEAHKAIEILRIALA
jgi:putative transposase